LVEGLLVLDEGKIYDALGYSSSRKYAQKHFGLGRTAFREALRVARAFRDLPETRLAFVNGLAYSRVKEITRVASAETEREWISVAQELSIHKLKVEVKDALAKKRRRPRAKSALYSLPAHRLRLPFDFAPEEFELADQALRKLGKELSLSLAGEEVDLKAALLYWLKRALETDPASTPEGRIEREESTRGSPHNTAPGSSTTAAGTATGAT
jgi:hypothetical protein